MKKQQRKPIEPFNRNASPEDRATRTASILDAVSATLAKQVAFLLGDLYAVNPDARQEVLGVASAEGLVELVWRRFDELRCNGPDAPDAPAIETIVRDAVARHPRVTAHR